MSERGARQPVGARSRLAAALLLGVAWLTLGDRPAHAHRDILIGSEGLSRAAAIRLTDADIAWAVYGVLPPGQTQHLSFERPASGQFRARALVMTRQSNLALNPWLALVGPGLPRPPELEALLGPDEGAILMPGPANRELEPFQDLPWPVVVGATIETTLPADGLYYLLIFDPSGQGGTFLIDTGYLQD